MQRNGHGVRVKAEPIDREGGSGSSRGRSEFTPDEGIRLWARAAPAEEPAGARLAVAADHAHIQEVEDSDTSSEEGNGAESEDEEAVPHQQLPKQVRRQARPSAAVRGGCHPSKPAAKPQAPAGAVGNSAPSTSPAGGSPALAEFCAQLEAHLAMWEASGGQVPHRVLQGAAGVGQRVVGRTLHKAAGVCVWSPLRPFSLRPSPKSCMALPVGMGLALCPGMVPGRDILQEVEVVVLVPAGTPGVAPGDAAAGGGNGSPGSSAAAGAAATGRAAAAAAQGGAVAGEEPGSLSAAQVPGHWLQVASVTTVVRTDNEGHCLLAAQPLYGPLQRAVPGGYLLAAMVVRAKQGAAGAGSSSSSKALRLAGGAQGAGVPYLELYVVPEALVAPHNPGGNGELGTSSASRGPTAQAATPAAAAAATPPAHAAAAPGPAAAAKRSKAAAGCHTAGGGSKKARVTGDPPGAISHGVRVQMDMGAEGSGGNATAVGAAAASATAAPVQSGHPGRTPTLAPAPATRNLAAPAAGGGDGQHALAPGVAPALVLPDPGNDFRAARVHLLRLLRQVLAQVTGLRHQALTHLLASSNQAQQQGLLELHYPLLQQVASEGDVGMVASLIEDISDSLS